MTDREIFDYLRKTQGWMPELAGPGPQGHIEATEETAAALPGVNTQAAQFEPQTLTAQLADALGALGKPTGQIPVPSAKPWPVAQKAGTIPQQDELLRLSKGETSLQFSDTSSNFQRFGLAIKQRSDAVSKVADAVNAVGAALNDVVDTANAEVQKRQRESGEWPEGFQFEGAYRRCPDCHKALWSAASAWKHVQKICPVVKRIADARAEYRPALQSV